MDRKEFLPEGFVADFVPGALPPRRTTLVDLLLDPYLAGKLEIDPVDARSWRDFLEKLFSDVRFQGDLSAEDGKKFQD